MLTKLVALGLVGFLGTALAIPCCTAMPAGRKVFLSNEDVIIVWDKEHGVEHFIRQATFNSDASDFGFIVPTPTQPELSEANSSAFEYLGDLIPPPPKPMSCGCSDADTGPSTTASAGVEVLAEQVVGKFQTAILKATDGKALNQWLSKNGYATRPAMIEWLDFYTKQDWVFTAFKFAGTKRKEETELQTDAIRVSFKTDRPHYPYKMPSDTWPEHHQRPMNVYFVSSTPIEAKYDETDKFWEAVVEWTGPIDDKTLAKVARELELKPEDMPKSATLTVFRNGSNPDGYGRDLYFSAGRPLLGWSWSWFAILLAFVGLMYWMKMRSRKMAGTG